jgi:phospho-2-dehydro-3-deoxyheptonate aldolase
MYGITQGGKIMSFEFIKKLPTPDEIRIQFAVPSDLVKVKEEKDREIRDVITGKSKKFLVIIGPCSADNEDAVCPADGCAKNRAGMRGGGRSMKKLRIS